MRSFLVWFIFFSYFTPHGVSLLLSFNLNVRYLAYLSLLTRSVITYRLKRGPLFWCESRSELHKCPHIPFIGVGVVAPAVNSVKNLKQMLQ